MSTSRRGRLKPLNRHQLKKEPVDLDATRRKDGPKKYTATVWYQDATTKAYYKWSIVLEDQPGVVAAFNAAFAALDIDPDHVAGMNVVEILGDA